MSFVKPISFKDVVPCLAYIGHQSSTPTTCHCSQMTDVRVGGVGERCPELQKVDFDGCTNLTDRSMIMMALAAGCPKLQEFHGYLTLQRTEVAALALADG